MTASGPSEPSVELSKSTLRASAAAGRPLLTVLRPAASIALAACAGWASVEWLGSATGAWSGACCAGIYLSVATLSGAAARRRRAEGEAHLTMLSAALEHMSNGLVCFDSKERLVFSNRRYRDIFGLDDTRLHRGMARADVVEAIGDANGWPIERRRGLLRRQQEWNKSDTPEPVHLVMDDGRHIAIQIRLIEGGGVVTTFDDVTKEHEAQLRIAELAFRDPLTRLPNRRSLQQRMENLFDAQQDFRLLLLDLDHFKSVNDTYGHGVGDKLLVQVAERLTERLGPEGFAARLGGDEMALIVFGDEQAAATLAEAVIRSLDRPFAIEDLTISIGCSIGECGSTDARDASGLMQFADIALYESKRGGRGRSSSYSAGMVETIAERTRLEADMHLASEKEMGIAVQAEGVETPSQLSPPADVRPGDGGAGRARRSARPLAPADLATEPGPASVAETFSGSPPEVRHASAGSGA